MPTPKVANQLINPDGSAAATATSAPGWFVSDDQDVQVANNSRPKGTSIKWGNLFSGTQSGNQVDFFVTGTDYFSNVFSAICTAKKCVFIAGWQVNYDVELSGGKTLFDALQQAIKNGATVYVMPWLSPKVAVDTGDFETMLAVSLLNAGLPAVKAFCLPAIQQGDQETLGVFFAHHQKLVVVDNEKAYVGGIDLAYGRRDDGNFSLKANGRSLNELYNSCIPPLNKLSNVAQQDCVTRAELLAACLIDTQAYARKVTTFITSPSEGVLAKTFDAKDAVADKVKDGAQYVSDVWNSASVFVDFTSGIRNAIQDTQMDIAQVAARWGWNQLQPDLRARIEKLRDTGSANAADAAAAAAAWLNHADLSKLPPALNTVVADVLQSLTYCTVAVVFARTTQQTKRYQRLFDKIKVTPKSGIVIDTEIQPRMPWHDVHSCIQGPAVFDLAANFISRWHSVAVKYEKSVTKLRIPMALQILDALNVKVPMSVNAPRIRPEHIPQSRNPAKGTCWVQTLRSGPKQLLADEAQASKQPAPALAQNNCLKAMLKAIGSAQKFIYIEGQFFQSEYGQDGLSAGQGSGPLKAMLDIRRSKEYEKFIDLLEIRGATIPEIPGRLRWAKIDDVMRMAQGPEFMKDLEAAIGNAATIEISKRLGKNQERLLNPIGEALASRIEWAIDDGRPFHVYMVLPVHPEGMLNVLNIMTQVHLTMQSLVHGHDSLVNRIRRAILVKRLRKDKGIKKEAALKAAADMKLVDLEDAVGDEWSQYLTLLNLRNWDTFGKRPVTEQIYVHSKLLIADDRVAILGSANINDRSQWGDRDSELAVIVTDDTATFIKLNGIHAEKVAASVHKLRKALWQKLFGLNSSNRQASALSSEAILNSPAAPTTWKAIQERAQKNADAYDKAFWFIPRSGARPEIQKKEAGDTRPGPPPASIWPVWHYQTYLKHNEGGALQYRMPIEEWFWREPAIRDPISNSWALRKDVKQGNAPETAPAGVEGFIVALPTDWCYRENNLSGFNLTVLAQMQQRQDAATQFASAQPDAIHPTAETTT